MRFQGGNVKLTNGKTVGQHVDLLTDEILGHLRHDAGIDPDMRAFMQNYLVALKLDYERVIQTGKLLDLPGILEQLEELRQEVIARATPPGLLARNGSTRPAHRS